MGLVGQYVVCIDQVLDRADMPATCTRRPKLDERIRPQTAIGASFGNCRLMLNIIDDAFYTL